MAREKLSSLKECIYLHFILSQDLSSISLKALQPQMQKLLKSTNIPSALRGKVKIQFRTRRLLFSI